MPQNDVMPGHFVTFRTNMDESGLVVSRRKGNTMTFSAHAESISKTMHDTFYVWVFGTGVKGPYFADELIIIC